MPSKPLRLLHIVKNLPTGGIQLHLLELLRRYDRKRFLPLVCSIKGKGQIGMEMENIGIEVICLNRPKEGFDWFAIMELYRLIKKRDIKIVRTHSYKPNIHGAIAARMANVPCIVASVHNVYEKKRERKFGRRIVNRCLSKYIDKTVAVSNAVKNDILKYDGIDKDKVKVIYNGIDIDRFNSFDGSLAREKLGIPPGTPVIGTVGRLHPQKGQKYLLEAVSILKNEFPGLRLLFAGDGILKNELETYAKTLGIKENVLFLGVRSDIPELLSAMDVFVFPSLWEGLGNALIEAMAAGKPVVASDIAPVREIINSKAAGILVPPEGSKALSKAIKLLLQDRALREIMGKAARERANLFSINSAVEAYGRLFEEILLRKGS
jgi:glycosyltransferase involved in cell wall biosynthesis